MRLAKLAGSAALTSALPSRQTAAPQMLVRLTDPTYEAVLKRLPTAPYRLTLAAEQCALTNLMAEALHPQAHWSLDLDTRMAAPPLLP